MADCGDPAEMEKAEVHELQERLDALQWQRQQQNLSCGPAFGEFYTRICDRIRAENLLETVMEDFEKHTDDHSRIRHIWTLPEVQGLQLRPNTSSKCAQEAASCEELYDMLVSNEANAPRALEVLQRALQKTPADDTDKLAVRYMKRAWALLLLERFDDAYVDANRSLKLASAPGLLWNAHEILGHYHAKTKAYKVSEANFAKALEGLRKSNASNEEKAAVAGRVATVLRMVKEENKPKNRAKETTKRQEESKRKRKEKKKQGAEAAPVDDNDNEAVAVGAPKDGWPKQPQVDFGKHPKLKNASAAVSVVCKDGRGRSVVANKDIAPGTVLMVDLPYAFVVNADQLHLRCCHCCRRCPTSVPCPRCAVVQYCNKECQKAGEVSHRLECSVMTHLYDNTLGKMAPLVFRILNTVSWASLKKSKEKLLQKHRQADEEERTEIIQAIVEGSELQKWSWEGQYSSTNYLSTFYLVSNSSKRTFGDLFKRSLSAVYITHLLMISGFFGSLQHPPNLEDQQFVATLAMRHMQSCSCNAYEISEMQIKEKGKNVAEKHVSLEIGGAIYPTISLTNHSCFPNVARYNVGSTCVLRATRFIPKDTEILDNYGFYFHVMPQVERRDALRSQYKFLCECDPCRESWPLYPHGHGAPVIYRCPAPKNGDQMESARCQGYLSYEDGRDITCSSCGSSVALRGIVDDINAHMETYTEALTMLYQNKFDRALNVLLQHQDFFDRIAVYPAKHFSDVQEMMRRCMNCVGNIHYSGKNIVPTNECK